MRGKIEKGEFYKYNKDILNFKPTMKENVLHIISRSLFTLKDKLKLQEKWKELEIIKLSQINQT